MEHDDRYLLGQFPPALRDSDFFAEFLTQGSAPRLHLRLHPRLHPGSTLGYRPPPLRGFKSKAVRRRD
jgi:hypothetical protein